MQTTTYTITVLRHRIVGASGKRAQQFWEVGEGENSVTCTSVQDLRTALLRELDRQERMAEANES